MRKTLILLILGGAMLCIGCDYLEQWFNPQTGKTVDQATFEDLPSVEREKYVLKAESEAEKIVKVVGPFANLVPWGAPALTLLVGVLGTYARVRRHLIGFKEVVAGVQGYRNRNGTNADDLNTALSVATSDSTKALIKRIKADKIS